MNRRAGIASGVIAATMVAIGLLDGRKKVTDQGPLEPVTPIDGGNDVVNVARNEARRWVGMNEKSPDADHILKQYWAATGQPYPGPDVAWSGAFINWVIANSDRAGTLLQSGAHIYYARRAFFDRNVMGKYGAYKPSEVTIEPGDIIVSSRPGGKLSWDDIAHGTEFIPTHGDIVVEASGNALRVVGGNVNDTVSERVVSASSPNIVAVLRYQHESDTPRA